MPSEIVPGLFVGDEADGFRWPRRDRHLCVKEGRPCGFGEYMPFFNSPEGNSTGKANHELLDRIADWITEKLREPEPVLIHCQCGVERGPLAVTWYLARTMGLDAAWTLVQKQRPQAEDRRGAWL